MRYLDWRLYARSDRYYIKRFEDETNLRCHLVVDMSRSMEYGSLAYNKADYARTVAATLAYFLSTQRDAVGLLTFDQAIADFLPPRYRPGHLHRLMMILESALAGKETNLGPPLEQIARTVSRRGLIVLISDLLAPLNTLDTRLGYLRSRGHEVVIFRVLDPMEQRLDLETPAMFEDLESGRQLYVDPESARNEYQRLFSEHRSEVQRICDNLGIDLFELTTDRSLELSLFDFLNARMRRGRTVSRRGNTRRRKHGRGGPA
jgi:uncharacterized protein (DUF58 family)